MVQIKRKEDTTWNGADEMAFQCYSKLAHGSVTERKKRGLPTKD